MQSVYFDLFIYLFIVSFIVRTIRNIFYYTFLWQLKEYRIDRFWAHLKTDQGKKSIFGLLPSSKNILFLFIFTPFGFWAYLLFGLTWILEAILYLRELKTRRWKIPKFTFKIIIILGIVLIFQFAPLKNNNIIEQLMMAPFLDRLLPTIVAFWVVVFNIPAVFLKKLMVMLAKRKIGKFPNLKVIGITGSYGKTSTKEFLSQVLSKKFKVLKTEGSVNTEIGVAKTILRNLTSQHKIFIVEMGAYKKGEIEAICHLVKPKIGIITGINEQHLQLFGSLAKIMEAKFELIKNLKDKGMAVFNEDNRYAQEMISWARRERPDLEITTYGIKKGEEKYQLSANRIEVKPEKVKFDMLYQGEQLAMELNLAGQQNVSNFLGAALTALKLGFSLSEIKQISAKTQSPEKTMKRLLWLSQTTFIDDTFNANPDGVLAVLEYMKLFRGRKILVLTPLIELGKEAERIHNSLGEKAAKICDLVLLTNLNYSQPFFKGAKKSKKVQLVNTAIGVKLIRKNLDKDGVVVFEGREAGRILNELVKLV